MSSSRGIRVGRLSSLTAIAGLVVLVAPSARANDISFLDSFRNISYEQVGNGSDLTLNGYFFSSDLITNTPNPYGSVTLTYPGPGSPMGLPQVSSTDYGFQTGLIATQAEMDADYPMGTYTFTSDTGDSASLTYAADDYAGSNPFLAGTDYTALQGMNPAQNFTVHFSPDDAGVTATASYIFFTVLDQTKGGIVAYTAGFLDPSTTSVVIPANTLTPGDSFTYELDFSNRDTVDGGGTSDFNPFIGFDIRADGTFSAGPAVVTPEPSTPGLLGFGLLAASAFRRRLLGSR